MASQAQSSQAAVVKPGNRRNRRNRQQGGAGGEGQAGQEKQVSQNGRGKPAEVVGSLREKQWKMAERTPKESCALKQSCNTDRRVIDYDLTKCSKI
jgi:hypothetical protein